MTQTPFIHDPDAEQAVLASVLMEPSCLFDLDLDPSEFWNETNRRIFQIMRELVQDGQTPDVRTVASRAQNVGNGASYLASLYASLPTASLVKQYAETVRRERVRRDLVQAATQISELAYHAEQVDTVDLVPNAQSLLSRITTPERGAVVPIASAIAEYMPQLEKYIDEKRDVWGVPTGLDLDKYIGGLIGGDLTVVAGRPGKGKTSLGMQVALDVAKRGTGVLVFSLEMARRQYMLRMLATLSGVNSETIRRGQLDRGGAEYKHILQKAYDISTAPLWIVDTSQSTDSIRAHTAKLIRSGTPIQFIVIDYADMLTDKGEKDERINGITRACKRLAREYDVCVWLLHAVNRKDEINLQSLKYGGDYDPDEVIFCSFADDRTDDTAELLIAKNRNGDTCRVPMVFHGGTTRWANATPRGQAEPPKRYTWSAPMPEWDVETIRVPEGMEL